MKNIIVLLILFSVISFASAYDYLLSDNNQGAFYSVSDVKLPETAGDVVSYLYDTSLGGVDMFTYTDGSVVTMDSIDESKMTDGFGGDSEGGVWGPWDGNKRLDVVFDLGAVYNINIAELRSYGLVNGGLGSNGVDYFTVRVNVSDNVISTSPDETGWILIGTNEEIEHEFAPNYVFQSTELSDPADPNSYEVIPVAGRYVWFEIHGLSHQVQVSELTIWGDTVGMAQNCEEVWNFGQGDPADMNRDCKVDLDDIVSLSADWLICNKPEDSSCDPVWY